MTQVDLPTGRSGMTNLERGPSRASTASSFVHLTSHDVVRHKIVQDIVDAYERADSPVGLDRSAEPEPDADHPTGAASPGA